MNKRHYLRVIVPLTAAVLAISAAGCGASAPTGTSTTSDGATLVTEQCGRCHPIERVSGVTKDEAGWTDTVGRMRTNGLDVTDAQAAAIIKYLTERDAAK